METQKYYTCTNCNKNYSSYQTLWVHNKNFHNQKSEKNLNNSEKSQKISVKNTSISTIKSYDCRICNKHYTNIKSRWSHEKNCKVKKDEELRKESEAKTVNITNNTNNGTINNNITINNFGDETVDKLTRKQIKALANMNLNAYVHIIELLNFNKDLPENHSFCVTSLEGDYVSYFNPKTKQIEKLNKKDFMDKVLGNAVKKLEDILFNIEFKTNENSIVKKKYYDKLRDASLQSDKIMVCNHRKIYQKNINELSYNKKKMILDTWKNASTNDINYDSDSSSSSSSEGKPYEYDLGLN
jgi:hypothetical protein